jgi:hypothetical protein
MCCTLHFVAEHFYSTAYAVQAAGVQHYTLDVNHQLSCPHQIHYNAMQDKIFMHKMTAP